MNKLLGHELIIVFMCAEKLKKILQPKWNTLEIPLWHDGLGFQTLWKIPQKQRQQEWKKLLSGVTEG